MKYLFIVLWSFLIVGTAKSDQPPDWNTFIVESKNGAFFANVDVTNKNGKEYPWDWKYSLTVIDKSKFLKNPGAQPSWEVIYDHPGYSGGLLSNDGVWFVYVDYWYHHNSPVIQIYSKNGKQLVTGSELGIKEEYLEKTVSHKLWLNGRVSFVEKNGKTIGILIDTVQGKKLVELKHNNALQAT